MEDDDPLGGGLPDAGGLNIDYTSTAAFEPTEEQLELARADLETIADGVRPHLTDGFTVTTRLARTQGGPQGLVVVTFPTGDAIGPGIPLTADRFESTDGPITPEEIESLIRRITTTTVAQWARMAGIGDGAVPAQ